MAHSPGDTERSPKLSASLAGEAVLTEAIRRVDILHTSLAGMTGIVVMLVAAIALPGFGYEPVTYPPALVILALAAFTGIVVLYVLNYRVHQHVAEQARLTEVLVNSLGQGFLVFRRDGICGAVYSQACLDLLEAVPTGRFIGEVLRIPPEQDADFRDWLSVLFQPDHALGFDDVVRFLPAWFPHSQRRRVNLVYRPVRMKNGALAGVVVIATDQTEEFAAQEAAKRQQLFAEMICRIFKEKNQFHATLAHVRDFLDAAAAPGAGLKEAKALLRQLHTLKASVKHFNLLEMGEVVHQLEHDLRGPLAQDEDRFRTILAAGRERVAEALARITEEVSDLIGEEREWRRTVRELDETDIYAFAKEMKAEGASSALVARYLNAIVAIPVRDCFRPFERELFDLAGVLDRQVKPIRYLGDNPKVLTRPLQEFFFSLTHICRNIIDHGIESTVTRLACGKDPAGQVTILTEILSSSGQEPPVLRIVISDDGNGIDPARIRARLATLDPDGEWRREDDQAVIQRIFRWGFTTRDQLTAYSGRGVGMDVVEREVVRLGGTIRVASELYKGASFEIRLPYRMEVEEGGAAPRGPTKGF